MLRGLSNRLTLLVSLSSFLDSFDVDVVAVVVVIAIFIIPAALFASLPFDVALELLLRSLGHWQKDRTSTQWT